MQLFSSCNSFRGTELFASLSDPGRYLTVDRFTDEQAWRAFLIEHRDAYARLDAATKELTSDECDSLAARPARSLSEDKSSSDPTDQEVISKSPERPI